jgi:hypothetical protein
VGLQRATGVFGVISSAGFPVDLLSRTERGRPGTYFQIIVQLEGLSEVELQQLLEICRQNAIGLKMSSHGTALLDDRAD